MMVQVLESLQPTWETQMECRALSEFSDTKQNTLVGSVNLNHLSYRVSAAYNFNLLNKITEEFLNFLNFVPFSY